jgi:hypothetical protein
MDRVPLRRAAVIPTALALIALGFLSVFAAMDIAWSYCPPENQASGMCTAPWYEELEHRVYSVPAAVFGFAFVFVPATVAPEQRRIIAVALFALGVVIVGGGAFFGFVQEAIISIISGTVALLLVFFVLTGHKRDA